jgi:hypothetical protein
MKTYLFLAMLASVALVSGCQSNQAVANGTMSNPNLCDSDKAQDEGFC